MSANEFYYNGDTQITCEEAHALKDKSEIVVADITQTKTMLNKISADKVLFNARGA